MDTEEKIMREIASKFDEEFIVALVTAVIETSVANGWIKPADLTDKQFKKEITKHLKAVAEIENWEFPIDYRQSLLKSARDYRASKKHEIAAVFFATWVEHWLNDLIAKLARRKDIVQSDIENIIRHTPLKGKVSWLLKLLDAPSFNKNHTNIILKIAEYRNSFIHYKYKEKNTNIIKKVEKQLNDFEKTIQYMHRYYNRVILYDQKRRIRRIVNEKST